MLAKYSGKNDPFGRYAYDDEVLRDAQKRWYRGIYAEKEQVLGQPPENQYIADSGIHYHDVGQVPGFWTTQAVLGVGVLVFLAWQFGFFGKTPRRNNPVTPFGSIYSPAGAPSVSVTGNAPKRKKKELTVPEKHQLKIAKKTLQMPDAMVGVMGGPTKAEAREIIKRLENPAGYYVMKYGGGRYTSTGWYPTREKAQTEVDRIKRAGAWSGMPPKVEKS